MGYDSTKATTSILKFDIDMASVSVALAVNMGIVELGNLIEVQGEICSVVVLFGDFVLGLCMSK